MKQLVKGTLSLIATLCLVFGCATAMAAEKAEPTTAKSSPFVVERVNINSADAETIANNLHRVGIKKAQAIVEWRQKNGNFKAKEQLLEVKGIGEATLSNNRDKIVL